MPLGSGSGVPLPASSPVSLVWVASLVRLFHTHTSSPLRIMSLSPSVLMRAIRAWSGPAYQTRRVFLPETSDARPWPLMPARSAIGGRPSSARWTTVPERPSRRAVWRSTSSWAAVRGGSAGSPAVASVPIATPPPITAAAAVAGTSQRSTGRELRMDMWLSPPRSSTSVLHGAEWPL
jgi:hypothetical protein